MLWFWHMVMDFCDIARTCPFIVTNIATFSIIKCLSVAAIQYYFRVIDHSVWCLHWVEWLFIPIQAINLKLYCPQRVLYLCNKALFVGNKALLALKWNLQYTFPLISSMQSSCAAISRATSTYILCFIILYHISLM